MTDDEILDAIRVRILEGRPTDHNNGMSPPAPASDEVIGEAEQVIGYPLPPLLRRIYGEIANGGVGPFGGVEGLPGGYSSDADMLDLYKEYRHAEIYPDDPPAPPAGVLFFCDFGCAMWSLLDCRHPQGQMWWWEEGNRNKLNLTLPEWLSAWLIGDIREVREKRELMLAEESWNRPENDFDGRDDS
jgi:hypothetical protein